MTDVWEAAAAAGAADELGRGPGPGPDRPCLNCGDPTPGSYCPACGQRKVDVRVSMGRLLRDVLEDQLSLDAKLPRTLAALLFRPGFLTAEYARGRVVRYIFPFRLYLITSVAFFLLVSFLGGRGLEQAEFGMDREDPVERVEQAALKASLELAAARAAVAEMPERRRAAAQAKLDSLAALVPASPVDTAGEVPDPDNWAAEIEVNTPWPALTQRLEQQRDRFGRMEPKEAARAVFETALDYAPFAVFLLLPIFTLLLKLLYIRHGRYYVEHFVFALHVHAFVFIAFAAMLLWHNGLFTTVLGLAIPLYMFLAMKRVYGQGFLKTSLKYAVLLFTYTSFLFPMAVALTIMAALALS